MSLFTTGFSHPCPLELIYSQPHCEEEPCETALPG
jgi:hypothetical protein